VGTSEQDRGNEDIGRNLRELRKARDLTLSGISSVTGVSISALSKIENGLVSPSFDVMKRICDGLDIAIEDLVAPRSRHAAVLSSGRRTLTRRSEGAHFTSGQYDYKAHATELSRKGMVPFEMRIRARSVEEFDHWSRHNGEEFVYVLQGSIEVHTDQYAPFRLDAGESAYFDSGMAHLYISVSAEDATVLSISYDPEQGRRHLSRFMNEAARPVDLEEPRKVGTTVGGKRRVTSS
jgi:transcriptional regulator with XRE-family HTH domain